jgi:hypothetical protein
LEVVHAWVVVVRLWMSDQEVVAAVAVAVAVFDCFWTAEFV